MPDTEPTTADRIRRKCDQVAELLCQKNQAYGDSALHPVGIFGQGKASDLIRVRIDDKLSRIASNPEAFGEDPVMDLLGYLILFSLAVEDEARRGTDARPVKGGKMKAAQGTSNGSSAGDGRNGGKKAIASSPNHAATVRGSRNGCKRPAAVLNYPPATDEEIAAYRRGLASGTLRAGSPNVVGSLIARIELETGAIPEPQERPSRPDPGHLAGVGQAEADWRRRSELDLTGRAAGK